MKTKLLAILLAGGLFSGCSTFQESHYSNHNTPYGNKVVATGVAANNAAVANSSHYGGGTRVGASMYGGYNPGNQSNFTNDIAETTGNALTGAIQNAILVQSLELMR